MITEWALRRVTEMLRARAIRAPGNHVLGPGALAASTQAVTLTGAPPVTDPAWWPGCVVSIGPDVHRVVQTMVATPDGYTIGWQRPLLPSEVARATLPTATVSVTSEPMTAAQVYLGGGPPVPVTVVVWCASTAIERRALGQGYGVAAHIPTLLVGIRTAFAPAGGEDFPRHGLRHMWLVEQVLDAMAEDNGADPARAEPTGIEHDWWREDEQWIYASDIEARMEVRA